VEVYYKEGFEEGVYRKGPYRQWVGYTDPRESSTGVGEGLREGPVEGLQGEGNTDREENWEGSTDGGGSFIGPQESWEGPREGESLAEGLQGEEREGIDRKESWEGLTDEEGSSTGSQDGWGGFPGENEAWEGLREGVTSESTGNKGLAGASGAWEGPREERGSSTGVGEAL